MNTTKQYLIIGLELLKLILVFDRPFYKTFLPEKSDKIFKNLCVFILPD